MPDKLSHLNGPLKAFQTIYQWLDVNDLFRFLGVNLPCVSLVVVKMNFQKISTPWRKWNLHGKDHHLNIISEIIISETKHLFCFDFTPDFARGQNSNGSIQLTHFSEFFINHVFQCDPPPWSLRNPLILQNIFKKVCFQKLTQSFGESLQATCAP